MNKSRMIFVTGCSGAVLAVYLLYAMILVPTVLPARERVKPPISPDGEVFKDRELLKILFENEDSWVFEKTNAMSFSEDAGLILFKEFELLDDSQLRVSPCVVICFPSHHEEMTPEEKYRQAVVLEATNHALLEFEGAIGFSSRPQLKSGQLNGVVKIRSQMKKTDPSDDLELITSDVLFDFNQIQTLQRVDFSFGRNKGYGHHLTIQMANTDESKKGEAPNTVKRIELRKLGELHLYVENDALNYTAGNAPMPGYHVAAYPQATPPGGSFQLGPASQTTAAGNPPSMTGMATSNGTTSNGTPRTTFSLSPQTNQNAGRNGAPTSPTSRGANVTPNMSEVLVMCQGVVDMAADSDNPEQWLLTFRNQVDVIRTNPQGASDQLNCQELTLTFGPKQDANAVMNPVATSSPEESSKANNNPLANFGSLTPVRVKAVGTPVVARSPENKGFQATGREMVLDLVRKELSLTQGDEVSVLYDLFKIRGKSIYYAYESGNGPGKLDMPGGGTLEGATGTDATKRFKLEWTDDLKVLPDKSDPNLTLVQIHGKPKAELNGIGTASADEILISCDMSKKPSSGTAPSTLAAANGNMDVDIKKLVMQKNVVLKTDSGEILTNELLVFFEPQNSTASAGHSVSRYPGPQVGGNRSSGSVSSNNAPGGKLSNLSFFRKSSDGNKSSYTVRADQVQVQASLVGKETVVEKILLLKNVKLDEKMANVGEEPVHLSGQTVRVDYPDSERMAISIFGDPNVSGGHAVFQGRGVMLMGANINVNRATNHFWVDGKGELRISQQAVGSANSRGGSGDFGKLFATSGSAGSSNQTIIINWTGAMDFDGKQLLFIKDVDIMYSMMAINKSERIEVHLTKPFRFFEKDNTSDIEPERVVIYGNIDLERDTFAENNTGQQTHDRIRLTSVEIFPKTGAFKGLGPGYVSSIFQYAGDGAGSLLSTGAATPRVTPVATGTGAAASEASGMFGKGLKFMQCNFSGSVEGNYRTSQVAFHDRVVTMLCPAGSFRDVINTTNPRNIVANGMLLECNKLEITQPPQGNGGKAVDLKAEGNTRIEMTYDSRYYIANADKIKFEQGKNLLTLEGNRYSKAELYQGTNLNSPTQKRAEGDRVFLNPVTKEVKGDGLSGQFLIQ